MSVSFPYRKFGPVLRQPFSIQSTWLADDHILAVWNSRFMETYRRFYFRDIQALILRPGPRFVVPTLWLWAVVALLIGSIFASALQRSTLLAILLSSVAAIGIYLLVAGLFRSCTLSVQTAIGCEPLPGIVRIGAGRRLLNQLSARITETQGEMPLEWEIEESTAAHNHAPEQTEDITGSITSVRMSTIAFAVLLIDALLTYIIWHRDHPSWLKPAGVMFVVIVSILQVVALIALRNVKEVKERKALLWAALAILAVGGYGTEMLKVYSVLPNFPVQIASEFLYWLKLGGEAVLGVIGLALSVRSRETGRVPSSTLG